MTTNGIPRPMKFNSMEEFVLGNSGQFAQSFRSKSPKSGVFVIKPDQSIYDRYNVNNLLLSRVSKQHIQTLNKNIILNQEDLNPNKLFSQTHLRGNQTKFAHTMKQQLPLKINNDFFQTNKTGIYDKQKNKTSPKIAIVPNTSQGFYNSNQKPSKQFSQNQLLFNFNQIADEKKAKKKQFLQTIEAKINQIQQEAKQLQDCQFQEEIQLHQIEKIHNQIGRQLTSNSFTGKINRKIQENLQNQDQNDQDQDNKPQSLHIGMNPTQINHILNTHYSENERLLDEIIRVKSKSRQKSSGNLSNSQWNSPQKNKKLTKTGLSGPELNQTSKTYSKTRFPSSQNQKKLVSTTTKFPPKQKR